jgi:hypothetical protein
LNVFDGSHLPRRADQKLFARALDVACPGVIVIALNRSDDVGQGQTIGTEPVRIRRDVVFLSEATDRIDFGHARDLTQLRLDDPVLHFAQVSWRIGCPVRLLCACFCFDRPEVDLAQASRNWPHHGRCALRQPFTGFLQSLVDQLAREVDVSTILENDCDLRQPVTRQ